MLEVIIGTSATLIGIVGGLIGIESLKLTTQFRNIAQNRRKYQDTAERSYIEAVALRQYLSSGKDLKYKHKAMREFANFLGEENPTEEILEELFDALYGANTAVEGSIEDLQSITKQAINDGHAEYVNAKLTEMQRVELRPITIRLLIAACFGIVIPSILLVINLNLTSYTFGIVILFVLLFVALYQVSNSAYYLFAICRWWAVIATSQAGNKDLPPKPRMGIMSSMISTCSIAVRKHLSRNTRQ